MRADSLRMRPRRLLPSSRKPPRQSRGLQGSFCGEHLFNPAEAGCVEGCKDFGFCLFAKVLQRFADRCVIQNAAVNKAELQRDRAFHVRTAMIDGAGHRQEPFKDCAGGRIILCLTSR